MTGAAESQGAECEASQTHFRVLLIDLSSVRGIRMSRQRTPTHGAALGGQLCLLDPWHAAELEESSFALVLQLFWAWCLGREQLQLCGPLPTPGQSGQNQRQEAGGSYQDGWHPQNGRLQDAATASVPSGDGTHTLSGLNRGG